MFYGLLCSEAGVHRVQRVPKTESKGRVHTSAAAVSVLPIEKNLTSIKINPKDLKIDTYRASGQGGNTLIKQILQSESLIYQQILLLNHKMGGVN